MRTAEALELAYLARTPTLVWGPPGVGKTAMIKALARRHNAVLIEPHIRSPEDLAMPVLKDGNLVVEPVDDFKRACSLDNAIVFIDELSTLTNAVQHTILRFLDSGKVGAYYIPPTVWRVAAANPADQAGGFELTLPTANRLHHVYFHLDALEWARDFVPYWGNPPKLTIPEEIWMKSRAMVAGFIQKHPHALLQVPKSESDSPAWPSPRSWDSGSRILAAAMYKGLSVTSPEVLEGIVGCVGDGAGREFISYIKNLDLPDPEELLKAPGEFKLPERGDIAFITLSSVVAAVSFQPTQDRYNAAWEIIDRAVHQGGKDVAFMAAVSLARLRKQHGLLLPHHLARGIVEIIAATE